MVCRICGENKKSFRFNLYGYTIVSCTQCQLVYTDFQPTKKFLKDFYSSSYFQNGEDKRSFADYGAEEKALRSTFHHRIRSLELKQTGKALDIGCAYGFALLELPRGWKKYGLEVSAAAVLKARKFNPKAVIKTGELKPDSFGRIKFDLITLFDVVEHLCEPKKTLEIVYKKLNKGGKVALTTGDVDSLFAKISGQHWHLYNPPQHLSYFSAKTIARLLKEIGFRRIKITHPAAYYPLNYLTYKLKNLYHLPLPNISQIDQLIIPLNLGDIMQVTAVK